MAPPAFHATVRPGRDAALIDTRGLQKTYHMGDSIVHALADVSLWVEAGEFVAIMGPSGSGKSTFMNLVGCLDTPDAGSYRLAGEEVSGMSGDELAAVRNRRIGFVFQQFNLLARTGALDNVVLPLLYAGVPAAERVERGKRRLAQVGLAERLGHRPAQLSGGQQQRVAIARALVNDPVLLLADEPTGALDSRTSLEVMALFQQLNRDGQTILMVTHEPDVAAFAGRIVSFLDGRIVRDVRNVPADAAHSLRAAAAAPAR